MKPTTARVEQSLLLARSSRSRFRAASQVREVSPVDGAHAGQRECVTTLSKKSTLRRSPGPDSPDELAPEGGLRICAHFEPPSVRPTARPLLGGAVVAPALKGVLAADVGSALCTAVTSSDGISRCSPSGGEAVEVKRRRTAPVDGVGNSLDGAAGGECCPCDGVGELIFWGARVRRNASSAPKSYLGCASSLHQVTAYQLARFGRPPLTVSKIKPCSRSSALARWSVSALFHPLSFSLA